VASLTSLSGFTVKIPESFHPFDLPESPDDVLTSTVSDALLFKAIAKSGGEEIDLKVKIPEIFSMFIQFSYF
jgi:hypothetical protein